MTYFILEESQHFIGTILKVPFGSYGGRLWLHVQHAQHRGVVMVLILGGPKQAKSF